MTQQDTPLVLWSTDDYLKQVELNRMLQQAGAFVFEGQPKSPLAIMVRAVADIKPSHSGDCLVLTGTFEAWNATPDPINPENDFTVGVYNQSDEQIDDGEEFMAQWATNRGGFSDRTSNDADGWVSAHLSEGQDQVSTRHVLRGVTSEDIPDGGKGDITIAGSTQTGIWEHATSGLNLLAGGDIWVYGPDDNGEYDIIGVDCRYVQEPSEA